jgi:hypothetical protein
VTCAIFQHVDLRHCTLQQELPTGEDPPKLTDGGGEEAVGARGHASPLSDLTTEGTASGTADESAAAVSADHLASCSSPSDAEDQEQQQQFLECIRDEDATEV